MRLTVIPLVMAVAFCCLVDHGYGFSIDSDLDLPYDIGPDPAPVSLWALRGFPNPEDLEEGFEEYGHVPDPASVQGLRGFPKPEALEDGFEEYGPAPEPASEQGLRGIPKPEALEDGFEEYGPASEPASVQGLRGFPKPEVFEEEFDDYSPDSAPASVRGLRDDPEALKDGFEGYRTEPVLASERVLPDIGGGYSTTAKEFPWQVYILTKNLTDSWHQCGGSIIDSSWIMSAAHCFAKRFKNKKKASVNAKRIVLYAGVSNLENKEIGQKNNISNAEISKHLFIHPNYTKGAKYNNDIALIKLKKPLKFNERVMTIPLATVSDFIPDKKQLIASGWGLTSSGTLPNILQGVRGLNLISRETCKKYWSTLITDKMICQKTKDKYTCVGDSGGPVITGKGESNAPPYVQIGIVSWGEK